MRDKLHYLIVNSSLLLGFSLPEINEFINSLSALLDLAVKGLSLGVELFLVYGLIRGKKFEDLSKYANAKKEVFKNMVRRKK